MLMPRDIDQRTSVTTLYQSSHSYILKIILKNIHKLKSFQNINRRRQNLHRSLQNFSSEIFTGVTRRGRQGHLLRVALLKKHHFWVFCKNMCILWGTVKANGRDAPSDTYTSYASCFGCFEVLLDLLKGYQINIRLGQYLWQIRHCNYGSFIYG